MAAADSKFVRAGPLNGHVGQRQLIGQSIFIIAIVREGDRCRAKLIQLVVELNCFHTGKRQGFAQT